MEICICDDDIKIHDQIKGYLKKYFTKDEEVNVFDFFCADELLQNENVVQYDIIFLDIVMGKTNGIKAAEKIRDRNNNAIIIFESAYPAYVFEAFRVEALHFMLKPFNENEFENVFLRAMQKYKELHSSITLSYRNNRYVINIDSITYIESYYRHITVYTADGKNYSCTEKLNVLEKELSPYSFLRIHQSFLVNMAYIKEFGMQELILKDNSKLEISSRKRKTALDKFDLYIKKRKW